jgi:cellulose synthase/poly-beta-1,6-N-acetylglucosamine synthase-like glycosyltransferase
LVSIHSGFPWVLQTSLFLVGLGLVVMTLPLLVELCVLTIASLLPLRRRSEPQRVLRRLAVVVPAHNEEKLIARCVKSLLSHKPEGVTVYVVAHNCSDRTAANAAKAGAEVLIVNDPEQRGKACALRSGFAHAFAHQAEAVLVIDADSIVSDSLLLRVQSALSGSDEAVQARYEVLPASPGQASLTSIAFQGFNIVRPRGRERLGFSVGIFGNGFGLRRELLELVPYRADSVVEDLEYHIQLVSAGKRVRLLEDATVYGEMPQAGKGSETQRARWEGGRLLMLRTFPLRLLRGILRGQLRFIEPLLDMVSLTLAIEVLGLLLLVAIPVPALRYYGLGGLLILCFHFLVAVKAGPDFWKGIAVLLLVPRYILWKVILMPKILLASRRNATWVRTQREEASDFSSSPPADALE